MQISASRNPAAILPWQRLPASISVSPRVPLVTATRSAAASCLSRSTRAAARALMLTVRRGAHAALACIQDSTVRIRRTISCFASSDVGSRGEHGAERRPGRDRGPGLRPVGGPVGPFEPWGARDTRVRIDDRGGASSQVSGRRRHERTAAGRDVPCQQRAFLRLEQVERRTRPRVDFQEPDVVAIDQKIDAVQPSQRRSARRGAGSSRRVRP